MTFPSITRSRLQALIEQGHATLDGLPAKGARRLKGGEEVCLSIPAPVSAQPLAQDLPLKILYQDRDLLVLDKAAGMVVHPAAGNRDGTLVNALLFQVKDLSGVGGELRPGIVHRIDKDTSGCLVVAKHDSALQALQASFKSRTVEKAYLAIVHGAPPLEGTFRTFHRRHPVSRKKFTGKGTEGKLAVTHFRRQALGAGVSLVEVALETGRTHQIRVHFAEAGFPLLGDGLYGGARRGEKAVREAIGRQALHAWKLGFPHPRTGKPLAFTADPPADFQQALERLGLG